MGESADGLDILIKVAIVNHEKTLFQSFVKTDIEVVDFRTKFRLAAVSCNFKALDQFSDDFLVA